MKKMPKILIALAMLIIPFNSTQTFFNYDYTKCQIPPKEPRLAKPWLSTLETEFFAGTSNKSFDNKGNQTELLDLHGHHNMRLLGSNIPNLNDPPEFSFE